jgi:hypothetical protein
MSPGPMQKKKSPSRWPWTRFQMEMARRENHRDLDKPEREECPIHGKQRVIVTEAMGKHKWQAICGVCKRLSTQEAGNPQPEDP